MPVKIRLQRKGKKRFAFYHIVIADSRAPRDGKTIESLGIYNPNSNPATIELDFNRALKWLQNGAQPTDTCRAILSYEGVIYKNHLLKGVTKGALTADQVELKFSEWQKAKKAKIDSKIEKLAKNESSEAKKRFAGEEKARAEKAEAVAKKLAAEAAKAQKSTEEVSEETESTEAAE